MLEFRTVPQASPLSLSADVSLDPLVVEHPRRSASHVARWRRAVCYLASTDGIVYTRQMFGQARGDVMVFARPARVAARGRRTHPAAGTCQAVETKPSGRPWSNKAQVTYHRRADPEGNEFCLEGAGSDLEGAGSD